jgi:hypothetical protein
VAAGSDAGAVRRADDAAHRCPHSRRSGVCGPAAADLSQAVSSGTTGPYVSDREDAGAEVRPLWALLLDAMAHQVRVPEPLHAVRKSRRRLASRTYDPGRHPPRRVVASLREMCGPSFGGERRADRVEELVHTAPRCSRQDLQVAFPE